MSSQRFTQFWAAETIRQQEQESGPLADDAANRRAQTATDAESFVLQRAMHLIDNQQLTPVLHSYQQRISAGLWLVFIVACFSGAGLALNLAPQAARDISLVEAVSVVILTNLLFMLLWLVAIMRRQAPKGPGYWLQYYLHKLTRDQQRLKVAQAYTQVCSQQGLLKPALSAISHGIWATILGAAIIVLTLRFIAYDYQFVWQTTLLSAQQISTLIDAMHVAPALLGIERPLVEGATQVSVNPRATAIWLLTCILLYALLPRLLLFVASEALRRTRLRQLQLDWTKPGYAELRTRFASGSVEEIDPAPTNIAVFPDKAVSVSSAAVSNNMLMTLELPTDIVQRLASIATSHTDLSWSANINNANERREWLNNLAAYGKQNNDAAPRVLLVINPLLSPDRGSLRFIEALTHFAQLHIILPLQHSVRGQLWSDAIKTHLPRIRVLTASHSPDEQTAGSSDTDSTLLWNRGVAETEEILNAWKA